MWTKNWYVMKAKELDYDILSHKTCPHMEYGASMSYSPSLIRIPYIFCCCSFFPPGRKKNRSIYVGGK